MGGLGFERESMAVYLFKFLIYAHIVTGAAGLLCVWVPIVGKKGGRNHRLWGKTFVSSMLLTGGLAIGISLCTLVAPLQTHPFWEDVDRIRGVFGWMMMYLAILTIMLAWYGLLCIRNKRTHHANRTPLNLFLQCATFVAAVHCAAQGFVIGEPLMIGISSIGLIAPVLNTHFILRSTPPPNEWLIQHTRGLVGAGISVYTAFLAFGAVNLLPQYAFNPILWATPTVLGVALLLYHQARITLQRRRMVGRATAA
ncbi:MAG: hypothetical protein AAF917_07430 [Pseudomonadota bacterium]